MKQPAPRTRVQRLAASWVESDGLHTRQVFAAEGLPRASAIARAKQVGSRREREHRSRIARAHQKLEGQRTALKRACLTPRLSAVLTAEQCTERGRGVEGPRVGRRLRDRKHPGSGRRSQPPLRLRSRNG